MPRRSPKGQGTVYKEDDDARRTTWRALKWVELPNGIRKRVSARGKTQEEALRKVDRRVRELENANPTAEKMLLRDYLTQWLEHKSRTVKKSTKAEYERVIGMVQKEIGHIPLARVKPMHVQRVIDNALEREHFTTANNIRRYFKQSMTQAIRWELLVRNPLANIPPVKRPPVKRGVWQPEEIALWIAANKGRTEYFAMFHTAIFTGLRRGELMALPWSNVTPKSIRVDRTASRYADDGWQTPKTRESTRDVPISREVYDMIADQANDELAFPNGDGTMFGERNVNRAFTSSIKRANKYAVKHDLVELPAIRLHDLRRTAATIWALQGLTPKHIQQLLGHSTPHLALAIYTDVMDQQVEHAAVSPGEFLSGRSIGRKTETEGGDS